MSRDEKAKRAGGNRELRSAFSVEGVYGQYKFNQLLYYSDNKEKAPLPTIATSAMTFLSRDVQKER